MTKKPIEIEDDLNGTIEADDAYMAPIAMSLAEACAQNEFRLCIMKLSVNQKSTLQAISNNDKKINKVVANSLSLKGLCTHDGKTDTWSLTDAGRAAIKTLSK